MKKSFHERAFDEYLHWLQQSPKTYQKINKLLKSI